MTSQQTISSHLLNFQVYLREKKILDETGRMTDMQAFWEAIVTTILKPIVMADILKLREMLDEEQPILTAIRIFIVFQEMRRSVLISENTRQSPGRKRY